MTDETLRYTDDPDTRLMMKFAAGDDAAFDGIVERFQRPVYGIIHRYLGGSSDADDCAQEVFIRLYRMRRSYKPTARLSTLVFRITANLCLNVIRDESKRRALALDTPVGEEGKPLSGLIEDENAVAPDEALREEERARIVRSALERIPERQRIALILHRFEGFSYKEIAETMETNVDAVKSLLSRARASLADALKGDMDAGNI